PAHGYGGEGILVVKKWDGAQGVVGSGEVITALDLESHIFDILEGAFTLKNLPDQAFIESRVKPHSMFKKLAAGGVPDIRIIVYRKVPVMAMLRLPTEESHGRANLHLGALGIGIDLRTGITTTGVQYQSRKRYIPGTKTKVRGIKIPQWRQILDIATRAQEATGLGFVGVDLVLDDKQGPMILEMNARPGLSIQLANNASLRTRLERVMDLPIPSIDHGIELARRLFAEDALAEVSEDTNVLSVVERVTFLGEKGKRTVHAKIDSGAFRTAIDVSLVEKLGLAPYAKRYRVRGGAGEHVRKAVHVKFRLRGTLIDTVASYSDRAHLSYPAIIGRRDLKGFLIDPATGPVEGKKLRAEQFPAAPSESGTDQGGGTVE
ncbi:hypothetical protein GVX82_02760, partial [Patescibacteria group bacterium]|nr:hypothetical protein [Patescibacteria group bacterium]